MLSFFRVYSRIVEILVCNRDRFINQYVIMVP